MATSLVGSPTASPSTVAVDLDDAQLLRYSRHILLNELGVDGQQRIMRGRALVIGVGGLGSPATLYLASAGIGHLTLVDHDTVDLTNLQRQIAHTEASVGRPKGGVRTANPSGHKLTVEDYSPE